MQARPDADPGSAAYGWRVLSVTTLGVMLCFINASTLNVALPLLVRDLDATPVQASWILLSYMLLTTVLILVFGRLADLLGRRRLYLAGLATLVAGSAGCGLAGDADLLLVFRCLQAAGAAAVITNTTALLTDAFPPHKLGLGLGMNASISAAAQSVGPIVGGVIVSTLGWRSIFLLNVPLGALALFWAWRTLRRMPAHHHDERFDGVGAALSMVGLAGIVYAVSMGGPRGWTDAHVIAGGLTGVVAMALFIASQRRRRHPLVDMGLFTELQRCVAYGSVLLISMAQISTILLIALFLQAVHGFDAMHAGLSVAPVPVGMMLASPVAGRLIGRMPTMNICLVGLGFAVAGLAILVAVLGLPAPYAWMAPGLFFLGVGTGLFLTPNISAIMQTVRPARRGIANGVRSALQNTGYVIGTALTLSIATAPLSRASQQAAYAGQLANFSAHDVDAFVAGCRAALTVSCCVCLAAVLLALWARRMAAAPAAS